MVQLDGQLGPEMGTFSVEMNRFLHSMAHSSVVASLVFKQQARHIQHILRPHANSLKISVIHSATTY